MSMINSKELKKILKNKMLKNFDGNGISRIKKKLKITSLTFKVKLIAFF